VHSWVVYLLAVGSGKYLHTCAIPIHILHDQQCNDRFHCILCNIKLSNKWQEATIFTGKDGIAKTSNQFSELTMV